MKLITHKRIFKAAAVLLVLIFMTTGCGIDANNSSDVKVVLTTGFQKDEIFRIDKTSCTLPEIMVYLTNTKNQYEQAFGSEFWEASYNGENLETNIKETVLARVARIKAMNLMAEKYGITLSDEELRKVSKAAGSYYESLTDKEKELLGVDEELLCTMYQEYMLAEKVYEYLIADINPEISDDEARTITVQHILIKTYSLNEEGARIPYSETARKEAHKRALEALKRAQEGEDFTALIAEYSEDSNASYSFGKGTMDSAFEEAAFNLATDEISGIVESVHGYHIIKCISTFNRDETDRNKVKIVEQRRKEVFNEEYSGFVEGLAKNLNQKLWDTVGFIDDDEVTTSSFFEVYRTELEPPLY
ncbi:MAG: peptidylprolyl isomerase [Lachnospiraceae bacterium]|nr:peptidylprolyl isomerase [Lachnospiraceae bacterium]